MRKLSIGVLTMAAAMVMMISAPEQTFAAVNSGNCGQTSACVSVDCKDSCQTMPGNNCGLSCETSHKKGCNTGCDSLFGNGCSTGCNSAFGNSCGSNRKEFPSAPGKNSSCGQNFIGNLMQTGLNSGMISLKPGSCFSGTNR